MPSYVPDCDPPDPNPRAPAFELPALSCDSHFHVFGPYERYPLAEERLFTAPEAPWQRCIAMHDALGLQRGVVVHTAVHGHDLRVTRDALIELNGRWRGIALLPAQTSARDIGELHEAGFRGVRLNFVDYGASAAHLADMGARLVPHGWHLQLLIKLPQVAAIEAAIRDCPVTCVIDHMGFTRTRQGIDHPGFQALLRLLRAGHCWVKVSGADRVGDAADGYAAARPFMQALVEAGVDRLVWGSDWPHVRESPVPNDGDLLDLFGAWVPDADARRRILVDNPGRLYGFEHR